MIAQITRDAFGFKVWKAGIALGKNDMPFPAWMPARIRDKWFKRPLLFKISENDAMQMMPHLFSMIERGERADCQIQVLPERPIGDMQ